MSRLSEAEALFVEGGAVDNVRVDGRSRTQLRALSVDTGVMDNYYGSARVAIGGTEVVVCLGAEIGETVGDEKVGRLEITVTSTPGSSATLRNAAWRQMREQELFNELLVHQLRWLLDAEDTSSVQRDAEIPFPMSAFGTGTAAAAASAAQSARQGSIDFSSLFIRENKCWVISVDVSVMSNDGCCLTAASIGCRAALVTARLPKVTVNAEVEGDDGIEVSHNAADAIEIPGVTRHVPLCVTLAKLGPAIIADPTALEEACPMAAIHVGVTPDGQISSMASSGGAGSGANALGAAPSLKDMSSILSLAPSVASQMFSLLEEQLQKGDE